MWRKTNARHWRLIRDCYQEKATSPSWLFRFVFSVSMNPADQPINFCITCGRYLASHEQATRHSYQPPHQPVEGPHHLYPPILVQRTGDGIGEVDYYVSVQALKEIQVPVGDVLSHLLTDPHPWLSRMCGARNNLARCLYLHPRDSKEEIWQLKGKCCPEDVPIETANRSSVTEKAIWDCMGLRHSFVQSAARSKAVSAVTQAVTTKPWCK